MPAGGDIKDEAAKAVGQVIVESARDGRVFLGRVFGPAATEFASMLGEQMRYWRLQNLLRILANAERLIEERGIDRTTLKSLPFGDAIRVAESASYEEEESVQELWARLIANAADPQKSTTVKKMFIDILRSLSAAETTFLNFIWRCEQDTQFQNVLEIRKFNEEMNAIAESTWRLIPDDIRRAAVQNLVRIRCLTFRPRPIDMSHAFAQLPREQIGHFNKWSAVDPERFQKALEKIGDLIFIAAGVKDYRATGPIPLRMGFLGHGTPMIDVPEMNFMLTPLGSDLMRACEKPVIRNPG